MSNAINYHPELPLEKFLIIDRRSGDVLGAYDEREAAEAAMRSHDAAAVKLRMFREVMATVEKMRVPLCHGMT